MKNNKEKHKITQQRERLLPDAISAFPVPEQTLKSEPNRFESNQDSETETLFHEPELKTHKPTYKSSNKNPKRKKGSKLESNSATNLLGTIIELNCDLIANLLIG